MSATPSNQPVRLHLPAGDWPEDFAHENGQYLCHCIHCEHLFIGHKRRVSCKVCASPPSPQKQSIGDGGVGSAEPCPTCSGHGLVGGLTVNGYESHDCPACHGTGLASGVALGAPSMVGVGTDNTDQPAATHGASHLYGVGEVPRG